MELLKFLLDLLQNLYKGSNMLNFLPSFIIGIIAIVLYLLNCIFLPLLTLIVGILRFLIPIAGWQRGMDWLIRNVFEAGWTHVNQFIMWLTIKTKFETKGTGALQRNGQYFLICNHQSWTDILVLNKVFGGRIPMLMFFMKKELIWMLPVVGLACWFAGYPFMKRYSVAYLKKHPEKKGLDLETTKRLCKRFKNRPLTVTSFIEGTRFTPVKKRQQHSPYKHLLKPKMSGFAFVLAALEKSLHDIINITIVYPEGKISLWDFICGRIKRIIVRYEVIPITKNLRGDYHDREFRVTLQAWLNQTWQEKDLLITEYLKEK